MVVIKKLLPKSLNTYHIIRNFININEKYILPINRKINIAIRIPFNF
jgi:hypothetical protein